MHARAGTIHEWFRHERSAVAMLLGNGPDDLAAGDQLVGEFDGRQHAEVELLLPGPRFMVSAATGDAQIGEGGDDFVANQGGSMSASVEIAARAGRRERAVREWIANFLAVVI